jgi:hypothetical protein
VFRYRERVVWATKGSPPNIIAVLARVVEQQYGQSRIGGAPETPPTQPRARLDRLPAKRTSPSSSLPMTAPPPHLNESSASVKTPQQQRLDPQQQQETNQDKAAAIALSRAIGQLPKVVISEQEWENAGRIRKTMFAASCCSSCALPTCKPFGINLHPQIAGALCTNSKMIMLKVMTMPYYDFNLAFGRGWSPAILHVLANCLA